MSVAFAATPEPAKAPPLPALLPKPVLAKPVNDRFRLTERTRVVALDAALLDEAALLARTDELLDLARDLKRAKYARTEQMHLQGKEICLIFEKTSTRTRCAFEVACHDQGANVTYLDPAGSQIGHKESMADTARVLSRMFDAIEYRGDAQATVDELALHADVPVYNGLTDEWHPTQMLADFLTMQEHSGGALAFPAHPALVEQAKLGVLAGSLASALAGSALLAVSEDTVKRHVSHILEKLDVNDRAQATAEAIRRGIVKMSE